MCRFVFQFFLFCFLFCCLTLTACVKKLPSTLPLPVEQRENALYLYQLFREENCSIPLDTDISIDIDTFAKHIKASGYMQLQHPENFRITLVDPVGRPLYIFVAADDYLTLVNSMKGEVRIGSVSAFLRDLEQDIYLEPDQVIPLLTGRFAPDSSYIMDVRRDELNSGLVWLVFSLDDGREHHVLFDTTNSRILRHIIITDSDDIELDIKYTWNKTETNLCNFPGALNITSDNLGGEAVLNYDLVLRPKRIPDKTFQLSLPSHYLIITVK